MQKFVHLPEKFKQLITSVQGISNVFLDIRISNYTFVSSVRSSKKLSTSCIVKAAFLAGQMFEESSKNFDRFPSKLVQKLFIFS